VFCVTVGGCVGPPADVAVAPAGTWTPRASIPGGGRLEAAVAAVDGRIVLVGGFDRELDIVARVDAYDPASDTWSAWPALPLPLTHANAVAGADGTLYVLGGLEGVDFAGSAHAFRLDAGAAAWTALADLPAGDERGASGVAALDDGRVVLAGGSDGATTLASVLVYDPGADVWARLAELPSPRSHPVAASIDGTLYVVGGLAQVDGTDPLDQVLALGGDGGWSVRAPMPTARGGCASGVLAGHLVCAGGETATDVVKATEAYDPASDTWATLAPMLTARAGTYGAVVADGLHVPGGARVLLYVPSAVHELLTWP
jgi:N-acetylneuraminic acid mutarotase